MQVVSIMNFNHEKGLVCREWVLVNN